MREHGYGGTIRAMAGENRRAPAGDPDTGGAAEFTGDQSERVHASVFPASHGMQALMCFDVGQHQMWAAQSLELGPD